MIADKEKILAEWDFSTVPSPCYVLHTALLQENMQVIDKVRHSTKAEIILALKANAMWSIFPVLRQHSDGATASSLAEARLVFEEYGSKAHTYAPVYSEDEIDEILGYSSHITFNSLNQYRRFGERALRRGVSCGLRVNPEYSTVETELYNPCDRGSRLGVLLEDLAELPAGIEGLSPVDLIKNMVNTAREQGTDVREEVQSILALTLARSAAIVYGQVLGEEEMANLVDSLFACQAPGYTPDGRTVLVTVREEEIEKRFA